MYPAPFIIYRKNMLYQDLTLVAFFILIYSLLAVKIEKLTVSGPILAVVFGLITGSLLLNFLQLSPGSEGYKTLAELALALVLFTDASKTNLRVLENNITIPVRLLLIGLPLSIVLGVFAGYLTFSGFLWIELAILATMLAPTDAALGKAVVSNQAVPSKIREALNVESGLNDGICVPVLFLLLALFAVHSTEQVDIQFGAVLFAKEIGIGLLTGLGVTFFGDLLILYSSRRQWIASTWKPIVIIALALGCFSLAQLSGGSGFIACFSGGLFYGFINKKQKSELLIAAEGGGDTLSLITWMIFGSMVIAAYLPQMTWQVIVYAILSLTLVRIIPVLLSLIKIGISFKERLFIGWFGPRGLASIVFAIIVLDINLPHKETIIITVVFTILLSVMAHGFSANPIIKNLFKSQLALNE